MKPSKYFIILFLCIPIRIFGDIIIVDQSGSGDYYTIQEGINNAFTGDTVLVFPGNYVEIIDFTGKDIVVASLFLTTQDTAYIHQTIINGNNNHYMLVRFTNGETENARLIGFTITNASAQSENIDNWETHGLGIRIIDSSPVIENNRIINNDYDDWYFIGGGIVMENSSAKIINNVIDNNDMALDGGGIYIFNGNNVLIENNTIVNNMVFSGYAMSHGAGIYIDSSTCINIAGNTISNNNNVYGNAGGIYVSRSNLIKIMNNNISENYVYGNGGGLYIKSSSSINISGNLTWNNIAEGLGGGMFFKSSEINFVNNTICFNQSLFDGGTGSGIYCLNSSPEIYNSIIYFNTTALAGSQVYLDANSDPNFFYSDIEGGIAAFGLADTVTFDGLYENNIESSPQFMNSAEHPFTLDYSSPCINAGCPDTTGLSIPEFDLAGNVRIVNDTIDMGAYENQLITNIAGLGTPSIIIVFPNPASDKITICIPKYQFLNGFAIIYDMNGNPILEFPINCSVQECNLSLLPRGIYMLKITNGEFLYNQKIILY